jgi:predicted Zn-dependent protease
MPSEALNDKCARLAQEVRCLQRQVKEWRQEAERWRALAQSNAKAHNAVEDERFYLKGENILLKAQLAEATGTL